MKNREYRALLTFALMMSLVVSSVKGTPSYVYAKEKMCIRDSGSHLQKRAG